MDQGRSQSLASEPPSQDLPDPAKEALEEPHLTAEELQREIGDSEAWDEASEDEGSDAHRQLRRPLGWNQIRLHSHFLHSQQLKML